MKRFFVMLLALLLAAGVCHAEGGEDLRLHTYVKGTLLYDAVFLDPHTGPGYQYVPAECGLREGDTVRILTRATDQRNNTWVLVEAEGKRVYLLYSANYIKADLWSIPWEPAQLESVWECRVYEEQPFRYGPGETYPRMNWNMSRKYIAWVVLMNGEWALVEQTNAYEGETDTPYFIRGWIPFSELIY